MRQRNRLDRLRIVQLILLLGLGGCLTSGEAPPARLKNMGDAGFEVTQELRIAAGLRSDFERAVQYIEEEDYESSVELLEKVTEEAPYAVTAHLDLGIAQRHLGDLEAAEASVRRVLELAPEHPAALNELGIILRGSGRFDEARKSYEDALRVSPKFHYARRNLAILCDLYLSDLDCAIENYEIYAAEVPGDEKVGMWILDLKNRAGR